MLETFRGVPPRVRCRAHDPQVALTSVRAANLKRRDWPLPSGSEGPASVRPDPRARPDPDPQDRIRTDDLILKWQLYPVQIVFRQLGGDAKSPL
jgi:hypothetical protein